MQVRAMQINKTMLITLLMMASPLVTKVYIKYYTIILVICQLNLVETIQEACRYYNDV